MLYIHFCIMNIASPPENVFKKPGIAKSVSSYFNKVPLYLSNKATSPSQRSLDLHQTTLFAVSFLRAWADTGFFIGGIL